MPNGADSYSHVTRIDQRDDHTVEIHVQTTSFTPGQEVEVSVYLLQGDTYAAFNDKKHIPLPDPNGPKGPAVLHVGLPPMDLDPTGDVTVFTRVSEVWPTYLGPDTQIASYGMPAGLKAVWMPKDPSGKEPGDTASPSTGSASGGGDTPGQQS